MKDIFVVRFRNDGKGISKSFVPFPDNSPYYPVVKSSYAYEVYKDLSRFADSATAILTRAAESKGNMCTGQQHFKIHPAHVGLYQEQTWSRNSPSKRTLAGMKTETYSQVHQCEYMRLETEEHMDTLVRMLGPTSVMGNWVKRPKVGFPHQAHTRSVLNQGNCADNETDEGDTFKRHGDIARLYVCYGQPGFKFLKLIVHCLMQYVLEFCFLSVYGFVG
jgi:hypothetical protein